MPTRLMPEPGQPGALALINRPGVGDRYAGGIVVKVVDGGPLVLDPLTGEMRVVPFQEARLTAEQKARAKANARRRGTKAGAFDYLNAARPKRKRSRAMTESSPAQRARHLERQRTRHVRRALQYSRMADDAKTPEERAQHTARALWHLRSLAILNGWRDSGRREV